MKEKDAVKPIKSGEGIDDDFFQEIKTKVNELEIRVNSKESCYFKEKERGNETIEVRLSNFIIRPLYVIEDDNKHMKYMLMFISKSYSKVVELDGETLSMNNSFKRFCMTYGKFNWKGTQYDLDLLAEDIMERADKELTMISYIGYDSNEKIWFFPTHAYFQGEVYFPDQDGVFRINKKHYQLNLDQSDAHEYVVYPHMNENPSKEEIRSYFNGLKKLYGEYAYLAFGYMTSSFHVDAISAKTDHFPFLYAHGKYSRGKSAMMNIFLKFAGLRMLVTDPPTLDRLRKGIGKKSGLPLIIDEAEDKGGDNGARGIDFFKRYSDVIKLIYMRQTQGRGHKDENKIVYYPVRSTLFLAGEVLTSVSSIIQRSVLIDSTKIIKNEEVFEEIRESEIPIWIGQYLMRTSHEWQSNILKLYKEINNHFREKGWSHIDVRVRGNYAIFIAGAIAAFQQLNKHFDEELFPLNDETLNEIYSFVYREMKETQGMTESDHPSTKFLTKIGLLANQNKLLSDVDYKCVEEKDGHVYLYLAPTNTMDAYQSHEKDPFYSTSNKAVKDIQSESFFKGAKKTRIGRSQPSAWIIQLTHPEKPELIKEGFVHPDLPDTMIYFYRG